MIAEKIEVVLDFRLFFIGRIVIERDRSESDDRSGHTQYDKTDRIIGCGFLRQEIDDLIDDKQKKWRYRTGFFVAIFPG